MEHLYSIRVLRNSLLRDSVFGVVFSWPKNKIGSKTISTLTYITTVIIWLLWATFVDSSCYNGSFPSYQLFWHLMTSLDIGTCAAILSAYFNLPTFRSQCFTFPSAISGFFFLLSSPRRLKEMLSNRCQSQLGRDC